MKPINALLFAALIAASLAAIAHGGEANKVVPVRKEQTDWGIAGDSKAVTRTIAVAMDDHMRFDPSRIKVKQGETVKFVVKNTGKVRHEFVIGTSRTLDEHAALMVKFPSMEHEEAYMAHVKPGAHSQVVWTFNRPGRFEFGCLIAGHYQAGMVGKITVAAQKNPGKPSAVKTLVK
jgi:uncharacterized cupredoxin-like copper-binding protein